MSDNITIFFYNLISYFIVLRTPITCLIFKIYLTNQIVNNRAFSILLLVFMRTMFIFTVLRTNVRKRFRFEEQRISHTSARKYEQVSDYYNISVSISGNR